MNTVEKRGGYNMCYECGCNMPMEKMTEDSIVHEDFVKTANRLGISLDEARYNALQILARQLQLKITKIKKNSNV